MSTPPPSALRELPTPALLVDVTRLERNIAVMADRYATAGLALRPHVKTSKCLEVVRRQQAAGAVGFTCSTAAEVSWLRANGVGNLLWAHTPVGPAKTAFVVAAARDGHLTVGLDSEEAAEPLSRAAQAAGVTVPFLLEVNTGHGRAGVEPADAHVRARRMAELPGLALRGVFTHEGHVARHVGDRAALTEAGRAAGDLLAAVGAALRQDGHQIDIVSVGSTPGATSAPFAPGVTEARPGTYVYFDANQTRLGSATLDDCALTVLATVVSTQRRGTAIIDAGLKAMSSDTIATAGSLGIVCDPAGRPLEGVAFSDGNEEHGFLTGPRAHTLAVGDQVRVIPNHACGTVNMFHRLYALDQGGVRAEWAISARH